MYLSLVPRPSLRFCLCTSLIPRPMTVIFGLGMRQVKGAGAADMEVHVLLSDSHTVDSPGSLLDPCNFHTIHSTVDRNGPGNRARIRLASMVLVSCHAYEVY